MATYDVSKLTKLSQLKQLAESVEDNFAKKTDLADISDKVQTLEGVGAQANTIEKIAVNGTEQTIGEGKKVDITVPTKVSDIENDSDYQTGTEVQSAINAKISSAYKAGGSKASISELPELAEANEGFVYNVEAKFTTTADFIEGAGVEYPAGTNVTIANVGTVETPEYKYDVLAGFVDLSGLVEKETGKGLSTNDYTTDDKTKLGNITAGATKVEESTTNGNVVINGEETTVYTEPADVLHGEVATDTEVAAMLAEVFGTTSNPSDPE